MSTPGKHCFRSSMALCTSVIVITACWSRNAILYFTFITVIIFLFPPPVWTKPYQWTCIAKYYMSLSVNSRNTCQDRGRHKLNGKSSLSNSSSSSYSNIAI